MEGCRKSLLGKRAEREPSKMEGGGLPGRLLASSNSSVGIKCSIGSGIHIHVRRRTRSRDKSLLMGISHT